MPIDKLDIKIQEAANQFEPAYNEHAWNKMEKLLDEQLPQQKKRHRKLLWLFLLLIMMGGSYIFFNQLGKKEFIREKRNEIQTANINSNQGEASSNSPAKNEVKPKKYSLLFNQQPEQKNKPQKSSKNNKEQQRISKGFVDFMNKINESNSNNIEKLNTNNHNNSLIQESRKQESPQTTSSVKDSEIVNVVNNKKDILFIKDRINNNSGKIKKTGSGKNKFTNSFSINFSAGPDVSAVTFDNIGKVNAAYGIGIGYNISKNWNVRTGFYIEKKLYQARPSDYHPPVRFWYNFPDLKTIDADCKVYAVPVIVSYNISENQKKIWFAGVGLASYFMKKETYDYNSKSASGQTSYISYTINNKNKHYFSILRLSAGYERKLSDNISFITEPYIGTPLSGVGFGKVKLYSSGVSFTLKVKPFSKK